MDLAHQASIALNNYWCLRYGRSLLESRGVSRRSRWHLVEPSSEMLATCETNPLCPASNCRYDRLFGLPAASGAPTLSGTFEPVDGGVGRVCRGAHENDNLAHYFDVQSVSWLSALTECGWSKSLFASRLAEMHEGVLGPRLCNPCLTHLTLRRLH